MNLALKRSPAIYLVGFMGCGKTTVGRIVAAELGWTFVDLDEDIERQQRCSIASIFDNQGEAEFRRIETEALRRRLTEASHGKPLVIALGGGAFTVAANRMLIAGNGVSVWLDCPLHVIKERVRNASHRPLARDPKRFDELFRIRQESYSMANYRIRIHANDSRRAAHDLLQLPIF